MDKYMIVEYFDHLAVEYHTSLAPDTKTVSYFPWTLERVTKKSKSFSYTIQKFKKNELFKATKFLKERIKKNMFKPKILFEQEANE